MDKRRTYSVIGKNIIKKMSNKTILDDVNITIEKQSIYAVLGENSSGKSVLLRCLSGILEQDGGEVMMLADDEEVASSGSRSGSGMVGSLGGSRVGAEQTVTRPRRPKIGFAPQNFDVPGPMRIYHLLYFIGAVNGLIVDQIVERYKTIVPITGLPVTTNFLVDRLRLSQKKVLSLVLAILHDPEVVILDDITTGMDSVTLKNCLNDYVLFIQTNRLYIIGLTYTILYILAEILSGRTVAGWWILIGILMNGKIITEDTTINLMDKFKTSSIEDLFIAIIFARDNLHRNNPAKRIRRLSIISNRIPCKYTSLLSSAFSTELDESEKQNVLLALILKNIWTLMIGIYSISFSAFVCVILFPLAIHWSFAAYPKREVPIMIHNEDLGDFNNNKTIEPMSNMFISRHLKLFFPVMYSSKSSNKLYDHTKFGNVNFNIECLLYFDKNYTVALRRRIERKIIKNADFENSQILITMNMTDGRKACVVKHQLTELYKQFLSDYAHNMMTEYVTDINDDSIKFSHNITMTYNADFEYPIYGRFVNSGLIVILTFFFHGAIAVRLQQFTGRDCYYDGRTSYLARLFVQAPIAIVWNAFMVVHVHYLYDIAKPHLYYVFLGLLLVSVCGIHLGYILCTVVKNHFSVTIILYLKFTICVYVSGLWWPTCELFGWRYTINHYFPISEGICFVRNLIERQTFVTKPLIIIIIWSVILVMITIVDIVNTKNEKRHNKLKNLL